MNRYLEKALIFHRAGDFEKAAGAYREGLKVEPDNADACHMAGRLAIETGDLTWAVEVLSRAAGLLPDQAAVFINLGSALRLSGQFQRAMTALDRALVIEPLNAEAHILRGHVFLALGQIEEAKVAFTQALALRPHWPEALEGIGYCLRSLGQPTEALRYYREATAVDPQRGSAQRLAGDLMREQGQLEEAAIHYRKAIAIDSADAQAQHNLGLMLMRLGEAEQALVHHAHAFAANPDDPNIAYTLSHAHLMCGNFSDGWSLYAMRHWLPGGMALPQIADTPPLVAGEAAGKRVLAWTDQGVGDTILFASLIPDLKAQCSALTIACDERLVSLFRRSFEGVAIIPLQELASALSSGTFDVQTALADTAEWLRPDFASFSRHAGYLRPDADFSATLRQSYRARVPADRQTLVGISWKTMATSKISTPKSLPLELWAPILQLPGITFINLQYGDFETDLRGVETQLGVRIETDPHVDPSNDLDAFAAQVAAMDFVITTSNTTAHMAGALNVPVWTFVPSGFGGLWHWFRQRSDSPWYPSMQLVRQRRAGDWQEALSRVAAGAAEWRLHGRPSKGRD